MRKTQGLTGPSIRKYSDVIFIYALLAVFVAVSSLLDANFLSSRNLKNVFFSALPFIIAAYAQTLAILGGGVDLSIGSLISLTTTLMATRMVLDSPVGFLPAIGLCLGVGVLAGLLNGLLIVKGKLQALIATLCTSLIFSGLALFILNKPGGRLHSGFARFMAGQDVQLILFLLVTAGLWLFLNRTAFGKAVYATGGNEDSAYSAGINTVKTRMAVFVLVSLMATLAGMLMACQMYSGDPTSGSPMTLRSMTAAVMGGASFAGGRGRVESTLAAALVLSIINNILNLVGLSAFYQYVVQGMLLIMSIAISSRYAGGKQP